MGKRLTFWIAILAVAILVFWQHSELAHEGASAGKPGGRAPTYAGPAQGEREAVAALPEPGEREAAAESAPSAAVALPELQPEAVDSYSLAVRVLDAGRAPLADVAVDVVLMTGRVEHILSERSDASGMATFSSFGRGWGLEREHTTGRAAVAGLFDAPVEAAFRLADLPREPLELVLPAYGALALELRESNGELLQSSSRELELAVARPQVPGAAYYGASQRMEARLEQGLARFEPLGLDLQFELRFDDRPAHLLLRQTLDGPRLPGEQRRETIELPEPTATVCMRVLDPAGQPLASSDIELRFTRKLAGAMVSSGEAMKTLADGRICFSLDEQWGEGVEVTLDLEHAAADGRRSRARIDLPRRFPAGTSELPDVLLTALAPLVSGRVVDGEGAPLEAVTVVVQQSYEPPAGQARSWWPFQYASTDSGGRFEVFADSAGTSLRLTVDDDDYRPIEPIEFLPGTTDLLVSLLEGSELAGSLIYPQDVPASSFKVELRFADGQSRRVQPTPEGRFELHGLPPGSHALAVLLASLRSSLLELEDVRVPTAGRCEDERLEGIDLRGLVVQIEVGVELPDGRPAEGGWVRTVGLGPHAGADAAFVVEGGRALVLVARPPLDLEVRVPGYRSVLLPRVSESQHVRLEPALRVRCRLAPEVELPPRGTRLQLSLAPLEAGSAESVQLFRGERQVGWWNAAFGGEESTFDDSRELELELSAPGLYRPSFHLVTGSSDTGLVSISLPATGEPLTLDASNSGTVFVVAPDPEAYSGSLGGG